MPPNFSATHRAFAAVASIALGVSCLALAPPTPAQSGEAGARDRRERVAVAKPCRAPFDRDPALFAAIATGGDRALPAAGAPPPCPPTIAGGGPPRRVARAP
jgi:hypothetical protein